MTLGEFIKNFKNLLRTLVTITLLDYILKKVMGKDLY